MASGSPSAFFGSQNSTSDPLAEAPAHGDDSIALQLRVIVIIFELLSLAAIALRLIARKISSNYFGWDDGLAILAGVLSVVNMVNDIVIIGLGAGAHLTDIDQNNIPPFLVSVYVGQVIYAPILVSVKLAILFLYLRLFNPSETFCKCVHVLIALTSMWGIGVFLTTLFQCIPVQAAWVKSLAPNAKCIDLEAFMIGANIPDIIFDIAILVLPIPLIWSLRVPTSKKIAILSIFLLAAFDLIMAVVRLSSFAKFDQNDPTWAFTQPMIWSTVEINVGIVCACLPVLAPIFQKVFGKWLSSWSTKGATSHKSGGRGTRKVTVHDIGNPSEFRRLGDEEDGMGPLRGMQKGAYEMKPPVPVVVIRPKSGVPF